MKTVNKELTKALPLLSSVDVASAKPYYLNLSVSEHKNSFYFFTAIDFPKSFMQCLLQLYS
jgi:hypothetical protein